MNIFIFDGYNVIYAVPDLRKKLDRSLEAARDGLLSYCARLKSRRGGIGGIYVVFDGDERFSRFPAGSVSASAQVIFTQRKEEADDRILSMIRKDGGKNSFIIVSNDNYVFNNSRVHGACVISVAEFCALLEPASGKPKSGPETPAKVLPLDKAKKITEEYKKHLGI